MYSRTRARGDDLRGFGSIVYPLRMLCAPRAMRSMRRGRPEMVSSPVGSPPLARSCEGTP